VYKRLSHRRQGTFEESRVFASKENERERHRHEESSQGGRRDSQTVRIIETAVVDFSTVKRTLYVLLLTQKEQVDQF
jgi:hypothetical protein